MSPAVESFGRAGYANRRLHLLDLDSVDDLIELSLGFERRSAILLAWDAGSATDSERLAVVECLLAEGAASVCCWGEGCDRVYTTLNDRILDPVPGSTRYSTAIMTTAHRRETFDQVLWYLLWCSIPDDQFESSCNDMLVLTIGLPELAIRARNALSSPDLFSEQVRREADAD